MSTRCVINFCDDSEVVAKIYRHCDGNPADMLSKRPYGVDIDLEKFFDAVEKECEDTRFYHAEYLAAKFVVWQARENSKKPGSLDFISLGVVMEDPGDIAYEWFVECTNKSRPKIRWNVCE